MPVHDGDSKSFLVVGSPVLEGIVQHALDLCARSLRAVGSDLPGCSITRIDGRHACLLRPDAAVPELLHTRGAIPTSVGRFSDDLYEARATIVLISLLPDVAAPLRRLRRTGEPFLMLPAWEQGAEPAARTWLQKQTASPSDPTTIVPALDATVAGLRAAGTESVILANVFRVTRPDDSGLTPGELLQRVRRANVCATDVSCNTGAYVLDLDRAFADRGARHLDTDHRALGPAARAAGGVELARLLFRGGPLDDWLEPEPLVLAAEHLEQDHGVTKFASSLVLRGLLTNLIQSFRTLRIETALERPQYMEYFTEVLRLSLLAYRQRGSAGAAHSSAARAFERKLLKMEHAAVAYALAKRRDDEKEQQQWAEVLREMDSTFMATLVDLARRMDEGGSEREIPGEFTLEEPRTGAAAPPPPRDALD